MAASAVIAPEEESVLENETVKARKPKIEPKPAGPQNASKMYSSQFLQDTKNS